MTTIITINIIIQMIIYVWDLDNSLFQIINLEIHIDSGLQNQKEKKRKIEMYRVHSSWLLFKTKKQRN